MSEEHPMRGGGKRPAWNHREAREIEEEDQEGGPGENLKRGGRKRKAGGKAEGEAAPTRIDHKARGGKPKKWIQKTGVDKPGHKGALHRALGIPEGQKIPAGELAKAAHSSDPHMQHMAQFAKNVRH